MGRLARTLNGREPLGPRACQRSIRAPCGTVQSGLGESSGAASYGWLAAPAAHPAMLTAQHSLRVAMKAVSDGVGSRSAGRSR
jgi:hypothetical protein